MGNASNSLFNRLNKMTNQQEDDNRLHVTCNYCCRETGNKHKLPRHFSSTYPIDFDFTLMQQNNKRQLSSKWRKRFKAYQSLKTAKPIVDSTVMNSSASSPVTEKTVVSFRCACAHNAIGVSSSFLNLPGMTKERFAGKMWQ